MAVAKYVIDTHALVWYLAADRRLGTKAKRIIESAESGQATIVVSVIVLLETIRLIEKGVVNQPITSIVDLLQEHPCYEIVPIDIDTVFAVSQFPNSVDLHDRIIMATAKAHQAVIITKDSFITQQKGLRSLW